MHHTPLTSRRWLAFTVAESISTCAMPRFSKVAS